MLVFISIYYLYTLYLLLFIAFEMNNLYFYLRCLFLPMWIQQKNMHNMRITINCHQLPWQSVIRIHRFLFDTVAVKRITNWDIFLLYCFVERKGLCHFEKVGFGNMLLHLKMKRKQNVKYVAMSYRTTDPHRR